MTSLRDFGKRPLFVCWNCDCSLKDQEFIVYNDNRGYCKECYDRYLSTLCKSCGKIISSSQTGIKVDEGVFYHEECLICMACGRELLEISFIIYEGNQFCEDCLYLTHGYICDSCDDSILPEENAIGVLDYIFHEKCFVCFECKNKLENSHFEVDEKLKFHCETCYANIISTQCTECLKPIRSEGIIFAEKAFHSECFKCKKCDAVLRDGFFVEPEDLSLCCKMCEFFSKICDTCQKPPKNDGNMVFINGLHFHPGCFKCHVCAVAFGNEEFVLHENEGYCIECFEEKNKAANKLLEAEQKKEKVKKKKNKMKKRGKRGRKRRKVKRLPKNKKKKKNQKKKTKRKKQEKKVK